MKVVCCDVNADHAAATAAEIGADNSLVAAVDVTDPIAVKAAMDEAVDRWGSLNVALWIPMFATWFIENGHHVIIMPM